MINTRMFEFLLVGVIMGIVSVLGATFSGFIQAFTAKNMGDDTAEQAGFLTLNPLAHIDLLNTLFLMYAHFGWSRRIPIDHTVIPSRLKLACVFFSNALAYLVILAISLFSLIAIFGSSIIMVVLPAALTGDISLSTFTLSYPEASSLSVSIGLVLFMFIYISTLFSVLHFLIDGLRFLTAMLLDQNTDFIKEDLFSFFLPILLIVFCAPILRFHLLKAVYRALLLIISLPGGY